MDVSISHESKELIDQKVASGEFGSAGAVIDEALRQLREHEREYGDWLRDAVRKGEESVAADGSIPVDEAFWARLKRRYQS